MNTKWGSHAHISHPKKKKTRKSALKFGTWK